MRITPVELLQRLRDAEDNMWSIINSRGYKGDSREIENAYKSACEYFDRYGDDLLLCDDEEIEIGYDR